MAARNTTNSELLDQFVSYHRFECGLAESPHSTATKNRTGNEP
jgi:hypothetical protein